MALNVTETSYQLYSTWKLPIEFLHRNRVITIISSLGILSNFLLLVYFYLNRSHINVSSATLVLIAVCDSLYFLSTAFFTISQSLANNYELPWLYCQLSGFITILSAGTSCYCLIVIAVERYIRIIHDKTITVKQLFGMWLVAFSSSAIQAVMPLATSTYFIPQDSMLYCLGNFSGTTSAHRIYSIICLVLAYCSCSLITFAYYSIYKKTVADGFKWNDFIFTKEVANPTGSNKHLTTHPKSLKCIGLKFTAPVSDINSSMSEFSLGGPTSPQQMRLTLRLAFYNYYFLTIWGGTILSWTYQAITTNRVSPDLDYALTFIPFLGSLLNPILVLTIDPRWRIIRRHQ